MNFVAETTTRLESHPPVILLGGEANALSVARSLSRLDVHVSLLAPRDSVARHSRHCHPIDIANADQPHLSWPTFLLGPTARDLAGSVLLACSDAGIVFLAKYRNELLQRYRLDESEPTAQLAMLDKLTTYQLAAAAGVPTPRFWTPRDLDELRDMRDQLLYPIIVKPRISHVFEELFGCKYLLASDFVRLQQAFASAHTAGIETFLVEYIPGADDHLSSYYTYLDAKHNPQFHYTKRILRRFPAGMGSACYHVTDWVPELPELALPLLRKAGLRGLANIEFKFDDRDGRHKLIECNARFTASNCLVAASGFDLSIFVYNRIVGRPEPSMGDYIRGLRLWDPVRDFWAFRQLHENGLISFSQWITSVMHAQTFPFFSWTDPLPAIARLAKPPSRAIKKLLRRPPVPHR